MQKKEPSFPVSDHAVVRYLERIKGINIQRIKRLIGSKEVAILYKKLGEGDYPVNGKFYARVVNDKVVTVLPINNKEHEQ